MLEIMHIGRMNDVDVDGFQEKRIFEFT